MSLFRRLIDFSESGRGLHTYLGERSLVGIGGNSNGRTRSDLVSLDSDRIYSFRPLFVEIFSLLSHWVCATSNISATGTFRQTLRQILLDALNLDAFAILLILNCVVNHPLVYLVRSTLSSWPVYNIAKIQRTVDLLNIVLVTRVFDFKARWLGVVWGGLLDQARIVCDVGQPRLNGSSQIWSAELKWRASDTFVRVLKLVNR